MRIRRTANDDHKSEIHDTIFVREEIQEAKERGFLSMINIAICDDDMSMASVMESMLADLDKEKHIQINCDVYYAGNELLSAIYGGKYYDLLYLDIELEGMDGIDVASKIREQSLAILIVYVSSHERYLKKLFDTEPFRFLSKPLAAEEFKAVFWAAYQRICRKPEYFSYVSNKVINKILINSITYFESSKRVVYVYEMGKNQKEGSLNKPEEKFYGKMNDVEEQLKNTHARFLRIHQSYLVNFDYIKRMTFATVQMLDGTVLQISKERQKLIRHQFCELAGMEVSSHVGNNNL